MKNKGINERELKYITELLGVITRKDAEIAELKKDRYMIGADGELKLVPRTDVKKEIFEAINGFAEEVKRYYSEWCAMERMAHRQYKIVADYIDNLVKKFTEGKTDEHSLP
jgi:hypothetical protein